MITVLLIVLAAGIWIVVGTGLTAAVFDLMYEDDPKAILYLLGLVFWVLTPLVLAATR